ncbi:hypothetical protein [Pseudaestuariivita atlantica]|uniref:Uncharacterized protein n=1 Tax=Pseudaestuariivita atlantica TaxID=1317121 RepID=A0A0L1JSM9_9RHOB|nr:hypothetical protein [Pseudaestuariivita atlantica]KNG94751.1 hypothetical protein ATO11_05000 [Pseudaestuariivita atlantica]
MSTYLSKEVQAGIDAARKLAEKRKSRYRVVQGATTFRILRLWESGFTLDVETAPQLRGLVDIYDGGRHLYQCLIVTSESDGSEWRFDFKRNTAAADKAPLDFYRAPDAPIALLGKSGG